MYYIPGVYIIVLKKNILQYYGHEHCFSLIKMWVITFFLLGCVHEFYNYTENDEVCGFVHWVKCVYVCFIFVTKDKGKSTFLQ